jgi:sulfur carrier protein
VTSISVNGTAREVEDGTTIAALVESLGVSPEGRGLAVALDAEVVPRGQWGGVVVPDGAQIEVVTAIQGG